MPVTIPPYTSVLLEARLPIGVNEWPGPPTWIVDQPERGAVALVAGMNQMQAMLWVTAPLMVTVVCLTLAGNESFDVDAHAPMPSVATVIYLS